MPLSVYTPLSDIVVAWGIVGGGGVHAVAVQTNNGDTSYVFLTYANTGRDVWAGAFDVPLPEEGAIITDVRTNTIGRATNTSGFPGNQSKGSLRLNGVNYDGAANLWDNTVYVTRATIWTINPATGLAWKASDFAGLQGIGLNKTDSLVTPGQIRMTQSSLSVSWELETRRNLHGILVSKTQAGKLVSLTPAGVLSIVD